MEEKIETQIKRRDFLKLSSATAAVAILGDKLLGTKKARLFKAAPPGQAAKEDGWHPGSCFMCTQSDCITRVHVVDGVVVKVEGNPKAITNSGRLCPRGNSAIMNLYNPWRVKAPLKRTNPKKALDEDPGFIEISWDEALQTVADRMKKIREDNPFKLCYVTGFGLRSARGLEFAALTRAYGKTNEIRSGGSACAYHFGCIYVHGQHPEAITDMDRCLYILNIGRGLGPNTAVATSGTKITIDTIERGCRIVNVDPRCSQEASKSEWLPIKPGTDLAFALGLAHTILYEIGTFDVWFVKNRTNAPYLIGPDRDYVFDKESNKPLIWDEVEGRARTFDEIPPMNSALEGTFEVDGVSCTPAFQLIKEAYKDYTPEWSESICTIPAERIRTVAAELVEYAKIGSTIEIDGVTFPYTPVSLQYQRGPYAHAIEGAHGDLVVKILGSLLGSFDVPGGTTGNKLPSEAILKPDEEGTVTITGEVVPYKWSWPPEEIDGHGFYRVSHTRCPAGLKAIVDPEKYHIPYEIEMIGTVGGNYFYGGFDREMTEKAYAKVPFSWVVSLVCDEPAVMSDIVLPDHSFMEREVHRTSANPHHVMDATTRGSTLFYFRDASKIRNPYNTMRSGQIFQELADRIGILPEFIEVMNQRNLKEEYYLDTSRQFTEREFGEAWLKSQFGDEWSLEDITVDKPPPTKFDTRGAKNYNYSYWPDNTTRHPFYMVHLLRVGRSIRKDMEEAGITAVPGWEGNMDFWWKAWEPIPVWTPCQEFDAGPDYDMWTLNWKTPGYAFYVGDAPGNVWLHEVMSTFDPYEFTIWMNTETAKKKGIEDGDTIIVESRHGKTQGKVKVTELIHPDALGFPGYHGTRSKMANPVAEAGAYFNALGSCDEQYAAIDPITGGLEQGWAVKVHKA